MAKNLVKITPLEKWVLLFTALFAAGTLLWFFLAPGEAVSFTGTGTPETVQEVPEPAAPGMLEGEVLDLNTATLSDLTRLPNIGESRAQDILDWRAAHGGFTSVEELLDVKGIGEGILSQLRPYVTVGTAEEGGDHGTDPGG